jgi:hypothetical protein
VPQPGGGLGSVIAKGLFHQRPPACIRDLHARDLDRLAARDHALGGCCREFVAVHSTISSGAKPCASMIASVQPSRLAASNSSAAAVSGAAHVSVAITVAVVYEG